MKRAPALLISLVLAVAVLLGSFAAIKSTQLSTRATAGTPAGTSQIARQSAALDRAEAALRAELKRTPPRITPLPAAGATAAPQAVIYRRAPTIVHVIHRHGGEQEHEGGEHDD